MRVKLLGPLEVEDDDGQPVAVTGAKQRALLGLLAISVGRAVSVERLIAELWGDAPMGDARNALQHQVSRLRKSLGRDRITGGGTSYLLGLAAGDVDAARFEQLATEGRARLRLDRVHEASVAFRDAEELWRGRPLAEFDDDWARVEATRLEQLQLDLVEDRVDADLGLGRHHEVVGELESLVEVHPFRERLWGQLMVARYRCGRQTDALAAFQQARQVLCQEHGLEPGPDLRALEAAVLRQDPGLTWTPAGPVPVPRAPSVAVVLGNLPAPLTSFIGREEQLAAIRQTVGESRLVTLTGTGGCGKTRLAIETARAIRDDFDDGAWMVELASLADASAVPYAVASVLAGGDVGRLSPLADGGPATAGAGLVEYLRPRRTLLVLDNCEHLLPAVTEWTNSVLSASPGLHVLATSREPLGITGEVQWLVPPLTVPDAGIDDPDLVVASEAVRLFEDRANRMSPFELTPDTAAAVADLCRHLDGLPLAIELAAARTKALPVSYIAEELDGRFRLLVSTSRTGPERQRTLRAALDWSYDLLDDDERTLFGFLSVCDGGCSLEAGAALAQAGGIDPVETVDLFAGLVDKSLVVARASGATNARYDMLETLRDYGREQLGASPRLDQARRAHRAFFVELAEDAEAGLLSNEYRTWQRRLEHEYGNLRAAYDSAMASDAWDEALRIASALWWFWASSDRHEVGRVWVDAALGAAGDEGPVWLRVRALTVLCYLAGQQLDLDPALVAGEEALALSTDAGDEWATAWAKQSLALTLMVGGDHSRSAALLAEAREVMDAAGEDWRVAGADLVTCVRALAFGELDVVDAASREVLRRAGAIGYEPFRCWGHLLQARVAERRGDLPAALAEAERALSSARRVELDHYIAFALTQLGRVALLTGAGPTAEAAGREAIAVAEAAGAGWFAALARVGLAAALWQRHDEPGASALLREVLAWGEDGTGQGREFFFLALGGDPVALASAQLG